MASLSNKIRQYCADNGVVEVDFLVDVLLQDDSNGQGPYIREWNISGLAQPTAEQLNAVDSAAELDIALDELRLKRNALLAETDFYGASDMTMSSEMTTYRQQLRDLTNGLTTVADVEAVVFPTKP